MKIIKIIIEAIDTDGIKVEDSFIVTEIEYNQSILGYFNIVTEFSHRLRDVINSSGIDKRGVIK